MKKDLTIRHRLQLSQQAMADYLAISASALKMYEQGHRSLPAAAVLKLSNLQRILNERQNQTTNDSPWQQLLQLHLAAFLSTEAGTCRDKIQKLQQELDQLVQQYESFTEAIATLDSLLQSTDDSRQRLWAEIQLHDLGKKATTVEKALTRCYCNLQLLLIQANAIDQAAANHTI